MCFVSGISTVLSECTRSDFLYLFVPEINANATPCFEASITEKYTMQFPSLMASHHPCPILIFYLFVCFPEPGGGGGGGA